MDEVVQVIDWKDRRGRVWFAVFDVEVREDEEVYRGVRLRSGDERTELTSAVAHAFADALGSLKERDAAARRALWRDLGDERERRTRGTRPGPKRKYESAEVARVVIRAKERGEPIGRALKKRFPRVSASYASRLVKRAEREGYLEEGER